MLHKQYIPTTTRIEAFSDGVIAIIITLMIFDLKVPSLPTDADSWTILQALVPVIPKFISFAMSFVVVAIFWVNHHNFFYSLKLSNSALLWSNNLLLFWLSVIPFPTSLLGSYPLEALPIMFYGFTMCMAATSFNLMRRQAQKYCLFHSDVDQDYIKKLSSKGLFGPLFYFASIVLAPIHVALSLAIFVLVPIIYFLPDNPHNDATATDT